MEQPIRLQTQCFVETLSLELLDLKIIKHFGTTMVVN